MSVPNAIARPMASARLKLGAGDAAIDVMVNVPSDAVAPGEVLPAVRRLQNQLVEAAEQVAARQGRSISCRAGCGACCRQPVPLADVEADALASLVEAMPEPRRSTIRSRFAVAEERLQQAGIADKLQRFGDAGADGPEVRALADQYFRLGIACPFLEEESCSIYADRPVICRAFVVTSPASFCSDVGSRDVKSLPVLHLSPALQGMTADADGSTVRRWVPMTLLYKWQRTRRPSPDKRPGPHWISALLRALQRTMTA